MKKNLSNITKEELLVFYRLDRIMIEFIPLKSNFRLFHLAYLIDYPVDKTSKLIKRIYNANFNIVVNFYRINYFEKLMYQELFLNKKIVISELIKKSGFKSRNTYYVTLKKINKKIYCNQSDK